MSDVEQVAVLFTDVVGSTELAAGMSVAASDEMRRKHFLQMRRAIAAHSGTQVKTLGDGVMVVFRTASSAVSCAVTMQQSVARQNRSSPHPIGLRVGISCGETTQEDDDYFGDPVIEAARLCAAADGGQVLTSEVVRALAGRRSSHPFSSLGPLTLRGLPEPVTAFEVEWVDPDAGPAGGLELVPLPVPLLRRPSIGVIGRDGELSCLQDAAKRVVNGDGREVILIAGEPGQGKTTLLAAAARQMHEMGMTVLFGWCDEDVGAPYLPLRETLGQLVAHATDELLDSHIDLHGAALCRLVPAMSSRLGPTPSFPEMDPESERYLMYAAVAGFLEQVCSERPVVLVIDDLHWADKPSLQLLRHLVSHGSGRHLLVLGTYRDAELSGSHPLTELLAVLWREPGVSRIDLKGLDEAAVVTFLESAAGHDLDDRAVELAHAVYRETDGNPFFVAEVLRHLSESGAVVQGPDGRWAAATSDDIALPESVRAVIRVRVDRIGSEASRVLSVGAVIGREFDLDLLAAVTAVGEDELVGLLERSCAAALVRELAGDRGRYSFTHALIQHTLYEDLGPTRRTIAHRQVGEALERMYGDQSAQRVLELTRHFLLSTRSADAEKSVSYARRAGESALAALAPDEAARLFAQALDLLELNAPLEAAGRKFDASLQTDLLIGLGTAQRQAGNPEFRATLLRAAGEANACGDTRRLVTAVLANNRGYFTSLGRLDDEKIAMLEAALEAVPVGDSPARARLLATLCSELGWGPLERRLALAEEATAMARRVGDPGTVLSVFLGCNTSLRIPPMLDQQLSQARQAIDLASQANDPVGRFWSANSAYIDATRAGLFEVAEQCLVTVEETSDQLHQPMMQWCVAYHRAAERIRRGDPYAAEELAERALEIGMASGQPDAFAFYANAMILSRLQQGRLGEAVSLVASAAEQNPAIPAYRAALTRALLDAGDTRGAARMIDEAAKENFEMPMDIAWLSGMAMYARCVAELGMRKAAEELLSALSPYHGQIQFDGVVAFEPVASLLGGLAAVLGNYEQAETWFREATELTSRGGMRYAEADTNLLWGRMLYARGQIGDPQAARDRLDSARSVASAHRYALVAQRAAASLL